MNRYRIVEQVPKTKARDGRGATLVDRLVRTLKKNGTEITIQVRYLPMDEPLQALSHIEYAPRHPKTGIYYEVTWTETSQGRKAPWQALAERSQDNG